MSAIPPTDKPILQALMKLSTNWAAGRLPLRVFAERDHSLGEQDAEAPCTAVLLGARSAAVMLGPYVDELLTTLTKASADHPDVEPCDLFSFGTFVAKEAIQRTDPEDDTWLAEEIDRGLLDQLSTLLQPFAWTSTKKRDNDQLLIPSPGHYAALQQAFALNRFRKVGSSPFPRAVLDKGGTKGFAELRPHAPTDDLVLAPEEIDAIAQRMWTQREELSDKDADTMDAISTAWIQGARSS